MQRLLLTIGMISLAHEIGHKLRLPGLSETIGLILMSFEHELGNERGEHMGGGRDTRLLLPPLSFQSGKGRHV